MLGKCFCDPLVLHEAYDEGLFDTPKFQSAHIAIGNSLDPLGKGARRTKRKYQKFCHALLVADAVNNRRGSLRAPVVAYRCARHACYHIGHNKRLQGDAARLVFEGSQLRLLQLRSSGWIN